MVDSVAALGGVPLFMDAWGMFIDDLLGNVVVRLSASTLVDRGSNSGLVIIFKYGTCNTALHRGQHIE